MLRLVQNREMIFDKICTRLQHLHIFNDIVRLMHGKN